jgi:hypothetical protein
MQIIQPRDFCVHGSDCIFLGFIDALCPILSAPYFIYIFLLRTVALFVAFRHCNFPRGPIERPLKELTKLKALHPQCSYTHCSVFVAYYHRQFGTCQCVILVAAVSWLSRDI